MAEENEGIAEEQHQEPTGGGDQSQANMLAIFCHLGGLIMCPVVNCLVALVIWLLKKDEFSLVDDQGKEALNFQITMLIAVVANIILGNIPLLGLISIPIGLVLLIGNVVMIVLAAVKVSNGEQYRYPIALRLIK
jgi:hypothetical protein